MMYCGKRAAGGVARGFPNEVLPHKANRQMWVSPSEGFPGARWTAAEEWVTVR